MSKDPNNNNNNKSNCKTAFALYARGQKCYIDLKIAQNKYQIWDDDLFQINFDDLPFESFFFLFSRPFCFSFERT